MDEVVVCVVLWLGFEGLGVYVWCGFGDLEEFGWIDCVVEFVVCVVVIVWWFGVDLGEYWVLWYGYWEGVVWWFVEFYCGWWLWFED